MPDMLTDLTVDEGSLVDRGANQTALVMLFKRRDGPGGAPPLNKPNRGGAMNESWLRRVVMGIAKKLSLSDEDLSKMAPMMPNEMMEHEKAMQEFWSLKYALSRSLDSIMESSEIEMDKKMEMVGEAVKQFQESCKALMPHVQMEQDMYKIESFLEDLDASGSDVAKVQTVVKALQPPAKASDNKPPVNPPVNKKEGEDNVTLNDIVKALGELVLSDADCTVVTAAVYKGAQPPLPETVTKSLTDLTKRAEIAEALAKDANDKLAAEVVKREKAEADLTAYVAKARDAEFLQKGAKYPHAGTPEQVAAKLRKAHSVSKEFGDEYEADLAKAEEQINKGGLFGERGKSGKAPEGSAEAQIEKLAKDRQAADKISFEKAYDLVLQENRDLHKRARAEQEGN